MSEQNQPLLPPPAGVQSNFVDPPSRASITVWSNAVGLSLMLSCVMIRLYVRGRIMRSLWWDDCEYITFPISFRWESSWRGLHLPRVAILSVTSVHSYVCFGWTAYVLLDTCVLGAVSLRAATRRMGFSGPRPCGTRALTVSVLDMLHRPFRDYLDG